MPPKNDHGNIAKALSDVELEALGEGDAPQELLADGPAGDASGDPSALPASEPSSASSPATEPDDEGEGSPSSAAEVSAAAPGQADGAATAATPADAAAEPGALPDDIPKQPPIPYIQPPTLPEKHEEVLADLSAKIAALRNDYDEGKLNFKDYSAKLDEYSDQRADLKSLVNQAKFAEQANQAAFNQAWQQADAAFRARPENAAFNGPLKAALQEALNTLYADPKTAGAAFDWFLEEARARVIASVSGLVGAPAAATPPPARAARAAPAAAASPAAQRVSAAAARSAATRQALPRTLATVPAAAAPTDASGDEFSALDTLSGMELEAALQRLPKDKADAYLNG